MKRRSRGANLIELTVVVFLMAFLIGGTFLIFRAGARGFQNAVLRIGAVGDAERFSRNVGRDVRLTHYASVRTRARPITTPTGELRRRDGFWCAALSDWNNSGSYLSSGLPDWDRVILYYATTAVAEETARLIRMEIDPGSPFMAQDIGNFASSMVNKPVGVSGMVRSNVLSKDVYSFEVDTDDIRRLITFRLTMIRKAGKRMQSEVQVEELQDLELKLSPLNSYAEI